MEHRLLLSVWLTKKKSKANIEDSCNQMEQCICFVFSFGSTREETISDMKKRCKNSCQFDQNC